MAFEKIIQILLIVLTCFQVVACQKKEGISEETMPGILGLAKKTQAQEYEIELSRFYFDELELQSGISGKIIPEPFKELKLSDQFLVYDFNFKPDAFSAISYVNFVDDLEIDCNGKIEFSTNGYRIEITQEQLLKKSKWRPLRLKICGQIAVPEGRKLFIYATNESKIKSLDIVTSPNSHLSLRLSNIEYSGAAPQIAVAPNSILKLNFN